MKVSLELAAYAPGTDKRVTRFLPRVSFDVALIVTDLRPAGTYKLNGQTRDKVRGVFAAYCDVLYNADRLQIESAAKFDPSFQNGKVCVFYPGKVEVGAFRSDGWSGFPDPAEVVRLRVTPKRTGRHSIGLDVINVPRPIYATLVFGNEYIDPPESSYVEPKEISLKGLDFSV